MAAEPGPLSARLALGWLIGGEWRFHPARFLTTAVAIAVGVALGFAVHLVNGSALASFDGAVRGVSGAAELSVGATSPLGLDERLYPRVASAAGVLDASPVVRLDARIAGAKLTLLGLDVLRAGSVTPSLVGIAPRGPDTGSDAVFDETSLFLSRTALAQAHVAVGDRVSVTANGRVVPLHIAGTLPGADAEAALGVIDIAAARAAPAAALKNAGDVLDPRRPALWWPAAVLLAAGAAAALVPAVSGLSLFGFLGMALMLAGGVAGVPWFARAMLRPLARRTVGSVPAQLAVRHLYGAPAEAATALCGIVASTALMIAMATMVTSFRGAVDTWLGQVLGADLYLRTNAGASFDPATRASRRNARRGTPRLQPTTASHDGRGSSTRQPDRPA